MMTTEEIHKLCDEADEIDPKKYRELCEADISEEKFIAGLQRIIRRKHAEN